MGNDIPSQIEQKKYQEYGQIYIHTEQKAYYAGQTVNGNFYLNLNQSFPGKQLSLKLVGTEETKWDQLVSGPRGSSWYEKCRGQNILYNHKVPLTYFQENEIPAGQYQYPFSFLLSELLPNSHYQNQKTIAIVKYTIQGIIEGEEKSWNSNEFEIIIYQKLPEKVKLTSREEMKVVNCCCCNQGNLMMTCELDKAAYFIGDNMTITTNINTTKLKLKVKIVDRNHLLICKAFPDNCCGECGPQTWVKMPVQIYQKDSGQEQIQPPENWNPKINQQQVLAFGPDYELDDDPVIYEIKYQNPETVKKQLNLETNTIPNAGHLIVKQNQVSNAKV